MPEPILVGPDDVERHRSAAREALRGAGLAEACRIGAAGPYGLTRGAVDLLEGLEGAVAAGLAARDALLGRISLDRAAGFASGEPTETERRFASAFGLAVACEEALAATDHLSEAVLPDKPFPNKEVRRILRAEGEAAASRLARDLAGYIKHYTSHPDSSRRLGDDARLAACSRSHLRRMALAARAVCDDPEHQAVVQGLATSPLRLPGVDYAGLERRAASDEEAPDLLDVLPEHIVGNEEVLDASLKLARAVASFDLQAGKNPRKVENPVLFVLGSPGCGKTVTAHAVGRYFLNLCRDSGIPARFRVIRRTDWASHYQNKSANDLLRIFRDEIFGFHGVCGAYWPDIDTAFAARSDPGIRSEEKSNLATLFGILDGTVGPRNGKWFLICDANYMQMDDAMVSRLTQDPKIAHGPQSPEQYVRLLRDIKLRGWTELLPSEEDWAEVGRVLAEHKLSGRSVSAIAGRISAELQDVEEPEGFFQMSYEEKVQALRSQAQPVTREKILEHIDHFVRFEREAADRAHRERFDRRVEEIRLQLSAHAAAVGG